MIAATPNSNLVIAVPTSSLMRSIKYGGNQVDNVFVLGTTSDFIVTSTIDCTSGRFFNELESRGGANVVVIGYDVADALFPSQSPIDKSVLINGQLFKVVGVNTRQGTFLGLFSTGLSLFVGAIGIMNITFVSVKERTKEIGTRKALGARRRTILLQFLIESTALCLLGGFIGLVFAYLMCFGIGKAFPSFPIHFSLGLVLVSMIVSIITGLFSGFAPAWTASRLDPVTALRYE